MTLLTKLPFWRNKFWTRQTGWGSFVPQNDSFSLIDRMFLTASLLAVAVLIFPHPVLAQSARGQAPFVFEVENPSYVALRLTNLPLAEEVPEELRFWKNNPEDARVPILTEYLNSKNPAIAPYASELLRHKNYRLILGISFAESNFCKKNIRAYNCWGVGGGNPESYANYPEAFTRANELIQKYHDRGMTTPKLMRNTWVGWQNDRWVVAVNQVVAELEALGL